MPINQFYSRKHFQLVSPRPDTAKEIEDRRTLSEVMVQIKREREELFPAPSTVEEIDAMAKWQDARIEELRKAKGIWF